MVVSAARESSIPAAMSRGVGAHQHRVGRLDRDIGAGADRDTDVRLSERGRVVDAVPDHGHAFAF
jgi:hypothetical protein